MALEDVNLKIRSGETVGVVGRSGCGKSTLIKVLMRVVHASEGEVFIKGMPLAEVSRETISQLIGYVGQAPFLFSAGIGPVELDILAEQLAAAVRRLPDNEARSALPRVDHDTGGSDETEGSNQAGASNDTVGDETTDDEVSS